MGRALLIAVAAVAAAAHGRVAPVVALRYRGGAAAAPDADAILGGAFAAGLKAAEQAVGGAEADLAAHRAVAGLGETCGAAYDAAVAAFDGAAEGVDGSAGARADLEAAVDAKLELLFLSQLALVRRALLADPAPDVDAALATFDAAAADAKRPGGEWAADRERASLAAVAGEIATRTARVATVAGKAAQQQQAYLQLFQLYQAQIAQLKQAAGAQPAQASCAYRVPDSDVALSVTRANDRTTLSMACVPDDSVPLLGPQGFVRGFSPLNVGLAVNIHV